MKITADTNVLVRAIVGDDPKQSRIAQNALEQAELVALSLPALCEFVWVLSTGYKVSAPDIVRAIRGLIDSANVAADGPAVEAGLAMLEAGGDFADGAIAYDGHWLGAEQFLSFDKQAVKLLDEMGHAAKLLT